MSRQRPSFIKGSLRADSKLLNLARTVHDPYVGSFGTNPKPLLAKTSLVPRTNHSYLKPENAAHNGPKVILASTYGPRYWDKTWPVRNPVVAGRGWQGRSVSRHRYEAPPRHRA